MISKYTKRTWLALTLAGGIAFSTLPIEVQAEESSQEMMAQKQKIDEEVKALATELAKLQKERDAKVKVFEQVAKEIKEVDADIAETTARIEKRSALLADRMRAYQAKDSGVNLYVDAVFSASSITDMMDRVVAVKTFLTADQTLIDEQTADNNALKAQKKVLAEKRQNLKSNSKLYKNKKAKLKLKKQKTRLNR